METHSTESKGKPPQKGLLYPLPVQSKFLCCLHCLRRCWYDHNQKHHFQQDIDDSVLYMEVELKRVIWLKQLQSRLVGYSMRIAQGLMTLIWSVDQNLLAKKIQKHMTKKNQPHWCNIIASIYLLHLRTEQHYAHKFT